MPYTPDAAHTETYNGKHIAIEYDTDPINPRKEYDNAATMICFHGRYNLGDEHDFGTPTEAVAAACDVTEEYVENNAIDETLNEASLLWFPLYLYDHSGITMAISPFSCQWDSGQVGFIYIDEEDAKREWSLEPGETYELWVVRVLRYLKGEVETYDQYLTGQVYGYVIAEIEDEDEQGEVLDSCWGFFGEIDYCIKEARSVIDAAAK